MPVHCSNSSTFAYFGYETYFMLSLFKHLSPINLNKLNMKYQSYHNSTTIIAFDQEIQKSQNPMVFMHIFLALLCHLTLNVQTNESEDAS